MKLIACLSIHVPPVARALGRFRITTTALRAITVVVFCVMVAGCRSERQESTGDVPIDSQASDLQPGPAPEPALKIGDPAPPLNIETWVTGQPIDEAVADGVYVVEFWATWCGPCRVSMPHLSELQQQYGDEVAFVGVTREDVMTVQRFLASEGPEGQPWDDIIQYRLATDDRGATYAAYMEAAQQPGIPTAFIVGRSGLIEWIGHAGRIDDPLRQVVDGAWDRQAAAQSLRQRELLMQVSPDLNKWVSEGKFDQALTALDNIGKQTGNSLDLMFGKLSVLQAAGREEQASPLRDELIEMAWDDSNTLNALAWNMASGPESGHDAALKSATRASELENHENPMVLATVARVHDARNDLDEAIRWQRKAVAAADGAPSLEKTLEQYLTKRAQPQDEPTE